MNEEIKLSERERKCLEVLVAHFYSFEGTPSYLPFKYIEDDTNYTRTIVKRSVRSLARKGLAEYAKGLVNEDGIPCGSGYAATLEGYELIEGSTKGDD